MTRSPIFVAAVLSGVLSLTAATLTYYDEAMPTTLNPLFSRSLVDVRTHDLIFDRLFYSSGITNELGSRIVSNYTVTDNGAGVQLEMKSGVKWHDGKSVRAEDVCFTIGALLDPETPSTIARSYRNDIKDCTVVDGKVNIRFKRLFHKPRERLGFHLLPEHVLKNTSVSPTDSFSSLPIGSGSMSAAKERREIRFKRHDKSHHSANIETISLSHSQDPLLRVRTLLNGGVFGLTTVPPKLRTEISASDEVSLVSYDLRSWWFIALNTNHSDLAKVEVRKALDLTLDRSVLRELTVGYDPEALEPPCTLITGPFVNSSPYYNRTIKPREHSDLNAAAELMRASGATKENGRWIHNGKPIQFTIGIHAPLEAEAEDLLSQIGNQLQAGGFDRQVYKVTNDDWSRMAITGQMTDFDILIGKWSFGLVEDVNALFHTREGKEGALNIFNYSNTQVDTLLNNYHTAQTDTEAKNAYHKLHALLAEELPYLFLWRLNTKSSWRNEVRNNVITPYYYFTEFDGWTFSP